MRFINLLAILSLAVLCSVIAMYVMLAADTSDWGSGTSRRSAIDNPGFALIADDIELLLLERGFSPCSHPASREDFQGLPGRWFRSGDHPDVYAFIYSDMRFFTADVFGSASSHTDYEKELQRFTDDLVSEFKELWDHDRYELQDWPDLNSIHAGEPCVERKSPSSSNLLYDQTPRLR